MINSVGGFNDELRWGWITVAGDIESVVERNNFAGDDLSVVTC